MADDLQNTNMFLAQQFGLAQQQYLNYANTDIAAFTTPPDGGPYGNGWVYFTTVTNGVIFQPSYPTVVNTVTGPAGVAGQFASNASNSAADAALSNENAGIANTNAWDAVFTVANVAVAANAAIEANIAVQIANANINNQANTIATANAYVQIIEEQVNSIFLSTVTVNAAVNATYVLVQADAAQTAHDNASAHQANANAWQAAGTSANTAAVLAANAVANSLTNTVASYTANAQLANTNANIANNRAWAAAANVQVNATTIATALGYVPYSSNGGTINGNTHIIGNAQFDGNTFLGGFGGLTQVFGEFDVFSSGGLHVHGPAFVDSLSVGNGTSSSAILSVNSANATFLIDVISSSNTVLMQAGGSGATDDLHISANTIVFIGNSAFRAVTLVPPGVQSFTQGNSQYNFVAQRFQYTVQTAPGVISVHHYLNNQYPYVTVANVSAGNALITGLSIVYSNTNTLSVDLSSQVTNLGTYTITAVG